MKKNKFQNLHCNTLTFLTRTSCAETTSRSRSPPFPPLRVILRPPAPLSPSSGGLAGRSDWERVGRILYIACSVGVASNLGALSWCFEPASAGGAGRRQDRSPLWRPWRTAGRAGSSRSASNKPMVLEESWSSARDLEFPPHARRGDEIGRDSVIPVAAGLDLCRSLLIQACCLWCAALGGRYQRRLISRSPLCWVVFTLFPLALPAS
jgi:hypothetical protein